VKFVAIFPKEYEDKPTNMCFFDAVEDKKNWQWRYAC